ncbi:MAG: STAS domain-containing protein [Chitinivibrionales bacterium]|nr:STAS domain-containing protein [Chitinivibrionales bacterium]
MERKISVTHTPALGYEFFSIQGSIAIATIVPLTTELNKQSYHLDTKDVVLELSEVNFIDSSGIRLLLNLKQRLETHSNQMYIMKPSPNVLDIFAQSNLTKVLTIIDSLETMEKRVSANTFKMLLPYTKLEEGNNRLQCSCAVCGCEEVVGYLTDQNIYEWRWVDDEPFPTAYTKEKASMLDFFGLLPIVCCECFMTSIRITDFNIVNNGTVVIKSLLTSESKNLLTKSIKKRKKIIETDKPLTVESIPAPRSWETLQKIYELAEFCGRTLSIQKDSVTPYSVGYLNYLCILYASTSQKIEYINNCRTWFTQALAKVDDLTTVERAISYFVLIVANINLLKIKEAALTYADFCKLIETQPAPSTTSSIMNPSFWFFQADKLWKKQIQQQSSNLKS